MSSHWSAASAPYTWDDFIALDDHERGVARLVTALTSWSDAHGGTVLASGYEVRVSTRSGVMPDVQFYWYAELSVSEYWIVDPEARTLERLVLREGAYVIAASLEGEDRFRPESFEGLESPLAKLWE